MHATSQNMTGKLHLSDGQGLDSETDQGDDGCHPVPWSGISSDEKDSQLGDCEGKVPERMVERDGKRSKWMEEEVEAKMKMNQMRNIGWCCGNTILCFDSWISMV